jgi:tetratricopeptide (TPR) repeat protein
MSASQLPSANSTTAQFVANTLTKAIRQQQTGNLEEAKRLCLRALAVDVRHADSLNLLGVIEYQLKRFDGALKMVSRAIGVNSQEPRYYSNLGMILRTQGNLDGAVSAFQQALILKPDFVEALNNLGAILLHLGKLEDARSSLERALGFQPDSFEVLTNYGAVLRNQGKSQDARKCLERALALNPECVEALSNMGAVREGQGELEEAQVLLERALSINPDFVEAINNLGSVFERQGKPEKAMARFEQALSIQPNNVEAQWNRSLIQLLQGNFAEGWRNYEWRCRQRKIAPRRLDEPQWRGEPLNGARILLHAEYGLGDSLQFLRYLPLVKADGGVIVLDVPLPLRRLAEQFADIAELTVSGKPLPPIDLHCPLMSLPLAFRTTLETIPNQVPYLAVPEEARQKAETLPWPEVGLRVGLVWAGSANHAKDKFRSIPLSLMEPLFDVEGVHFFSLQMGPGAEQLATVAAKITNLASAIGDMADTAALLANLDVLIAVDTSVVHLAGALGKPAWVMIPYSPDWRWLLEREDSPWYPTVRLFRQPEFGDWQSVILQVRAELSALAEGDRTVLRSRSLPELIPQTQPAASAPASKLPETARRQISIDAGKTDLTRWVDENQLEKSWDGRASCVADYIPSGAVVLDLGCGRMALERFLPANCRYVPCDLVQRDKRTIVCEFNTGSYPDEQAATADIVTLLGVLEYIFDPLTFLQHLRQWQRPVIMTYCATNAIIDRNQRRNLGWVNSFSFDELVSQIEQAGFSIQRADQIDNVQWLFRLQPKPQAAVALKRVAVLSYNNVGNFGDRLGYHLVNDVLPAHAEVTQLHLRPWTASNESYDLLVVGIGNSMFGSYINNNLLSLVERSRVTIGIFGTQYHESMPTTMLKTLVNRLDHWYARNEEDVLRYGKGLSNVSYLGDWLIKAFPMNRPTTAEQLNIGKEVWNELPLDRTIQKIQQFGTVFSERIHPLLCALTSAERVGYREQREEGGGMSSGKFRSMLVDIFGRTFPEETLFEVNRAQVLAYKQGVEQRVQNLKAHIHRILGTLD